MCFWFLFFPLYRYYGTSVKAREYDLNHILQVPVLSSIVSLGDITKCLNNAIIFHFAFWLDLVTRRSTRNLYGNLCAVLLKLNCLKLLHPILLLIIFICVAALFILLSWEIFYQLFLGLVLLQIVNFWLFEVWGFKLRYL